LDKKAKDDLREGMNDYERNKGLQNSWNKMQTIVSWVYNGHKYEE